MEVTEMTVEEIREGYDRNDQSVIDGVLRGTIKSKKAESTSEENVTEVSTPIGEETTPDQITSDDSIERTEVEETPSAPSDIELEQRYAETVRKQEQEKQAELLLQMEKTKQEKAQAEEARKQLERRVKELEDMKSSQPEVPVSMQDVEDDEYASEYAKTTRKMIQEMRSEFNFDEHPKLKMMEQKLKVFEQNEAEKAKREHILALEKAQKEQKQKLFGEIESFQSKHPDFKTSKPISQLNDEATKFRQDLAWLIKADSEAETDKVLAKFFDEEGGEGLRVKAEQAGIRIPQEYEKFSQLAKLWDLKNGLETDPVSGSIREIKDEFGNPVRYRSVEEAYILSNYHDEINRARREARIEVRDKVNKINSGASTLDNNTTSSSNQEMSAQDALQIIRKDSRDFRKVPGNLELLQKAYARAKIQMSA